MLGGFIEEFAVSWYHVILALAILAFLFPRSRRILVDTVRNVLAPIVAVLFVIATRLR